MATVIERFQAISDLGETYTVIQYQHWTTIDPLNGPKHEVPGSTEWKTTCGIDLQENDDGTFEMIQIDGVLRRV